MSEENRMQGADYIHEKMQALYPTQKGMFFDSEPLYGVAVYASEKGFPHWHYVTYGFSQLFEEEENAEDIDDIEDGDAIKQSGFGFELTFRLKKDTNEPPEWPVELLQDFAEYVFSTGSYFGEGHHLDRMGPIAPEVDTKLVAIGFDIDPELGEIDTCNGHVKFLQAIAITMDEMYAMMHWDGVKFIKELFAYIPYGIADLDRDSLLDNEEFKQILDKGIEEDGSSSEILYAKDIECYLDNEKEPQITIKMGAMYVESFLIMLRGRVEKQRRFYIMREEYALLIEYADQPEFGEEEGLTLLRLPMVVLKEIQSILRPQAGTYVCKTMALQFIISRSEIKDSDGDVIRVIE